VRLTRIGLTSDIGLQTSQLIMNSDDPLLALTHLSQDFPKYSAAIARNVEVSSAIRGKAHQIVKRGRIPPAIYINGKAYKDAEINPYS
jgi:UDP-glucose:glycoprotein glucosyltransferase